VSMLRFSDSNSLSQMPPTDNLNHRYCCPYLIHCCTGVAALVISIIFVIYDTKHMSARNERRNVQDQPLQPG
jgi:hypothetical protein